MKDFNEYFKKQGSLYLKDINFELITLETSPTKSKVVFKDSVDVVIDGQERLLKVIFTRYVSYVPKSLYELSVSFGAIYSFKDEIHEIEKLDGDIFKDMLTENRNNLFINIISRSSLLISQISSSHGAAPLITPPTFIKQTT